MKDKITLISSICIGGYNDTLMYDTEIEYQGKRFNIEVDKCWNDSKAKNLWKIESDLKLNYDTKKAIIEIISRDMPSIESDIEPKQYNIDIFIENKIKSIEGWYKSNFKTLEEYLHIGDIVDQSMANYFAESNPVICNGEIVQLGGAYSSDLKGRNTYLTIARDNPFGDWIYKGACLRGETINKEYEFEEFDIESQDNEIEEESEL